jgi:membrane protein
VPNFKRLIQSSLVEWNNDNAPRLAAALAFYTLLSLSPTVIVVVGMAGLVFGQSAASGELAWEIHDVVGWDGARVIQAIVHSAHPHAGMLAAFLSLLALVLGASSVVVELRSGLNTIWHIPPGPSTSTLRTLLEMGEERFYCFTLVTGGGILLVISVAASAWMSAVGRFFGPRFSVSGTWTRLAALLVSYVAITFLFAAIYRVVPEVRLQWNDVIIGAAVTSLIFTGGKQLIALYLGKAAFASTYGAAGSFVILLVWVYYSAQLFFFGAEFTKVYARMYGSHAAAAPAAG